MTLPRRINDRLARPVTTIGWGAFKIGRNEGVKYPAAYDLPSEAEARALIHAVIDMGIEVIDTAPAYGLSEARLGAALGARRDQVFLSTKAGEIFEDGCSRFYFGERAVMASVQRSLERLGTSCVDMVWVHSDGSDRAILREGGALRALEAARHAARTRGVGFSPKTLDGAMAAVDDPRVDAVMLEFHPRDASMLPAVEHAGRAGKAVFVKKPLASGHLTPSQALPWILSHPQVTCVVVGGLHAGRLSETVALASHLPRPTT
jgi:aryl-alcohol dehydrogenase-like predicted oxidoreductase